VKGRETVDTIPKGVGRSYSKRKPWRAWICGPNGVSRHLGNFATKEEAVAARRAAEADREAHTPIRRLGRERALLDAAKEVMEASGSYVAYNQAVDLLAAIRRYEPKWEPSGGSET
jgi:hypothetical protein